MSDELRRYADDDNRPAAMRDELRAMRAEGPSDDSRRATLAALLGGAPPPAPATARRPSLLRWSFAVVALALLALALLRLLGR